MKRPAKPEAVESAPQLKQIVWSARFTADVKRRVRAGNPSKGMIHRRLNDVQVLLSQGKPLPARYRDHPLGGDLDGCRDLHLFPDIVLIYRVTEEHIYFVRLGSHAELFE